MTPQLERLYREHQAFVYRTVQRFGVPYHAVDDAVHDTFLVIARRLHEFEGTANIKTWVFAIAMRVAQGFRRDHRRFIARFTSIEGPNVVEPIAPDVSARRESAELLHRLLDQLDDDQRATFILMELEGMTAPEVASALGAKLPTIYSRHRLAREKLTKLAAALDQPNAKKSTQP